MLLQQTERQVSSLVISYFQALKFIRDYSHVYTWCFLLEMVRVAGHIVFENSAIHAFALSATIFNYFNSLLFFQFPLGCKLNLSLFMNGASSVTGNPGRRLLFDRCLLFVDEPS